MEKLQRELVGAVREMIEAQGENEATRAQANEAFMDAFYALVRDILCDDGYSPASAGRERDARQRRRHREITKAAAPKLSQEVNNGLG